MKKIIESNGYFLKNVRLTESGKKKVSDAFTWHFRGGWAIDAGHNIAMPFFNDTFYVRNIGSVEDWIFDIEADAINGMHHPECNMNGEDLIFEENVDYVIEMQSEEALDLEIIANNLNKLHEVFEQELNRLGW